MAALKEVKSRIQSVHSTQKITSAMKMVSSSKLRKAQRNIENLYPYQQKITNILANFLNGNSEKTSIYAEERPIQKVAIVVFSSNSSLCGSFNSNVTKKLIRTIEQYQHIGKEHITIYTIGKKIAQSVKRIGFEVVDNHEEMADKPTYQAAQELGEQLMEMFKNEEIDKVELIYHHFESKSSQLLQQHQLLPLIFERDDQAPNSGNNYLIEPDREKIMEALIPKVIKLQLFTALLDSNASEHAARTIAMQTATDNADDLLAELKLQYNKSRQQAITAELLDIIGGSFGQ